MSIDYTSIRNVIYVHNYFSDTEDVDRISFYLNNLLFVADFRFKNNKIVKVKVSHSLNNSDKCPYCKAKGNLINCPDTQSEKFELIDNVLDNPDIRFQLLSFKAKWLEYKKNKSESD